jgi:hypothetical protein
MAQDPKKKKSPKTHTMTAKSGGKIEVTKKSVDDAKAKTGAFKERPAYGGKEHKNEDGKIYGTTSHAGVFTRTTGPVERRKASKALERGKALHKADSTQHSATIKGFQGAKRKGTE